MAQVGVNLFFAVLLWVPVLAVAQATDYTLVIKDHKFLPEQLKVPAGQKVKILIDNQDAAPEEFDSYALNREKVIAARGKGIIFVGPLKPGTYAFMGEFHQDTARGTIIVQ